MSSIAVRDDIVFRDEFEENNNKVVKKLDEVEGVVLNGGEQVTAALEELIKESYEIEDRIFSTNREIRNIKERLDIVICHYDSQFKLIEKLVRAVWTVGGVLAVIGVLNIVIP